MSKEDTRELIGAITDNSKRLRYYELVKEGTHQSDIADDEAGNPTEQIKSFSDYGLIYRNDGYVHQLSPLGRVFAEEFDELLEFTSDLMEMRKLYDALSIQDAEFLNVEKIKGGEVFGSANFKHVDRWREHLQHSVSMKQYAPKRAVPHKGGRSPSHEAIVDGDLEQVKFLHSSQMRDGIEDRKDDHKEAAEHEVTESCEVNYRIDVGDEIGFNETFAIFDYGSGEKYLAIYVKNDEVDNTPPTGGRLLYEVSTDKAVDWAEQIFDDHWASLEPYSYNNSYKNKWQ